MIIIPNVLELAAAAIAAAFIMGWFTLLAPLGVTEAIEVVSRPRRRWAFWISDKNEGFETSGTIDLEAFEDEFGGNVREVEVTVTTDPTYPLSLSGVFSRVSSQLSTYKCTVRNQILVINFTKFYFEYFPWK